MGKSVFQSVCPKCLAVNSEDRAFCRRCGSSLRVGEDTLSYGSMPPQHEEGIRFFPGDKFSDRYQIIEEIGRGGMGRVYKARDKELNVNVALKIIRPEFAKDPTLIKRFKKETRLARSISHENVVSIFDIGELEQTKFISMEYIKGQNLKELLRTSGALTVDTAVHIGVQICRALKSAHQKGVIHCDLKPSNIMVDRNGDVHVMDFGLAKLMQREGTSLHERLAGTPPYFSPEQASGEDLDQRSDIYSIGCILYEMLTGKPTFSAESTAGYIDRHIRSKPRPPRKIRPDIPHALEKTVLKCLEKRKSNRFQTCEEIIQSLMPTTAEKKSSLPSFGKQLLKKPLFYFILIIMISMSLYFLFFAGKKEPAFVPGLTRISLAVLPFENRSGDPGVDKYKELIPDQIILDTQQSRYIFALPLIRLNAILKKMKHIPTKTLSMKELNGIAKEEKIQYFVQGKYSKLKKKLHFTINIIKPPQYETAASTEFEIGEDEDYMEKIDEMTVWLKTEMGFTRYQIIKDEDVRIKSLTKSPRALQLYFTAEKYYCERNFQKSIQALEEAIQLDPDFAMAYRKISDNYSYLGEGNKALQNAKKARELADQGRGSLRDRLLIQGYSYNIIDNDREKAIEAFKKVLEIYPEDEEAHAFLGSIYRTNQDWDLAEKHFLKIQLCTPDIAYSNLAWIYLNKGRYNRIIDLFIANKDIITPIIYYTRLADTYFYQGRTDPALKQALMIQKLFPDSPGNPERLGNIYQAQGNLPAARRQYEVLTENAKTRVLGRFWILFLLLEEGRYAECEEKTEDLLAGLKKEENIYDEINALLFLSYLQFQRHRFKESLRTCSQILDKTQEPSIHVVSLCYRGLNHLRMQDRKAAAADLNTIEVRLKQMKNPKLRQCYYQLLKGNILLDQGNYPGAQTWLNKAYASLPSQRSAYDEHAFFLGAAARAYSKSREWIDAITSTKEIQGLTAGRLQWGDIYVLSFYWAGKAALALGQNKEALGQFAVFLKLWKNADPDLPEIVDAKRRIKILHPGSPPLNPPPESSVFFPHDLFNRTDPWRNHPILCTFK